MPVKDLGRRPRPTVQAHAMNMALRQYLRHASRLRRGPSDDDGLAPMPCPIGPRPTPLAGAAEAELP